MDERVKKCLEAAFAEFSGGDNPKTIASKAVSRLYLIANTHLQIQGLVPRGVRHFVSNHVNIFLEERGYRRIRSERYDFGGYRLTG